MAWIDTVMKWSVDEKAAAICFICVGPRLLSDLPAGLSAEGMIGGHEVGQVCSILRLMKPITITTRTM